MKRFLTSPVAEDAFAAIAAAPFCLLVIYYRLSSGGPLCRRLVYYHPQASSLAHLQMQPVVSNVLAMWDADAGCPCWIPLDRVEKVVAPPKPRAYRFAGYIQAGGDTMARYVC